MRVTVVGCAGSFPGPDSPASCYLLEAEGFRLVIDMGNGALGVLQRYAGLFSIDAICLSHLHADHCIDLGAYWVARQFPPEGPQPPIPVYGPRGTAGQVKPDLGPDGAEHIDGGPDGQLRFDFRELEPGSFGIGPFRLTADHMNHPVETFGFRLEHGGRSLAYSADTGETDALVRLARDADLLLCEASLVEPGPGEPALPEGLHLTGRQAAQYAARAGAGQLVLTHLAPWNDAGRTLDEADRAFSGPMSLAASGMRIAVD
jgi:ribonuclease BN (tRNA processing enzyme)